MNIKFLLNVFLAVFVANNTVCAQELQRGNQILTEDDVVSGKPYLLYYVGNGNSCYVKAKADYFKAEWGDNTVSDEAIFLFHNIGEAQWQIQSWNTGSFFPVPTKSITGFVPAVAAEAGVWALNFLTNGNMAPSGYNSTIGQTFSLNRANSNGVYYLHGWDQGTGVPNQLRIYDIVHSTTANTDFDGKEVNVSSSVSTPTIGQWYVIKKNGSYFTDSEADGYISNVVPRGFATARAKYLVRLVDAGDGRYFVETGYGNYLFTGNVTTRVAATTYSLDELTTGWNFHLVTLADPLRPDASEVYSIKTDDETGGSERWVITPDGYADQYYLYNVGQQKFAYPTASGSWVYSEAATPVVLESQGDGHHVITTKDGEQPFRIGSETRMRIVKEEDVTPEVASQLTAANDKLLYAQAKITNVNQIEDGWYGFRIVSDSSNPVYGGNFVYTLTTEKEVNGRLYPMSHGGEYNHHPASNEPVYYLRLWPVVREDGTYYHWQVPSGRYVVNYRNEYPIVYTRDASDFIIDTNADGTFYIQSSGFRAEAKEDFIGKTPHKYVSSSTKLEFYKVDVAAQGLQPWQVIFNAGVDDVKLHCTRSDVRGLTDVYNRGYFFLPVGVTPQVTDFTMDEGMWGEPTIDVDAKTISVVYAPAICFTGDDVTVAQGFRTTGKGNTRQALLRVEINPVAPCNPTQFDITLIGAAKLDKVEAYMTKADQLFAEGESPILLGTQTTLADGAVRIMVSSPTDHLLTAGTGNYMWITADVKTAAAESDVIDAAITSIGYQNQAGSNSCDVTAKGNPDGNMRVFMRQQYVWVSNENGETSRYYRSPALLNLNGGKVVAFCEYRYDNAYGLGKDYDGTDYGHHIDVVMRRSTDNGATWEAPVTVVAAGVEGSETEQASGYANPAVVLTGSGKIICLMTMGRDAYDSGNGLKHIAMTTSDDYGTTWAAPEDIFDKINWNGVVPKSAYVTSGKGVVFDEGRVAFIVNAKVGSQTNDYVIYSDDEGASWTVAPTALFANGKEGKLEVMNDQRLLGSVSRGADTAINGRGYNTTKGDASASGVGAWNISSDWGGNLNSYGCNNDIMYYGRSPEAAGIRDAILHTVIKGYSDERTKDMRLYTSFEQAGAGTWKELFTITPANAGSSSMQKLGDGNLAIFFEDGSVGNDENAGCYALNCVVISKEQIEAQMADLYTAIYIKLGETNGSAPYVTWREGSGNWYKSVTSTSTTGIAGVNMSAQHYAFNRESDGQRVLVIKPSAANATDVISITAPDGYIIKSYDITGYNKGSETYTLTAADGTSVELSGGKSNVKTLSVDNVYYKTTTFSMKNNSGTNGSYANIRDFRVVLAKEYSVELHQVYDGSPSYATLYVPFDITQTDGKTKAYYIREVREDGSAVLTRANDNGNAIAHHTAVVLVNEKGATHVSFAVTSGLIAPIDEKENMLKGTLESMPLDLRKTASNNYYSLGRRKKGDGEWVAGFYKSGALIMLGANRAYLDTTVPVSSTAKGFDISFYDDGSMTSDIMEVEVAGREVNKMATDGWYTLDGRKLPQQPSTRGVYIYNGIKVIK